MILCPNGAAGSRVHSTKPDGFMPQRGERSGCGSVFKKLGDCPRVLWLFILLGPKRNFLAGFVKSPNRWRWLAHDAVDLGRQRRKSAVCLTSSK